MCMRWDEVSTIAKTERTFRCSQQTSGWFQTLPASGVVSDFWRNLRSICRPISPHSWYFWHILSLGRVYLGVWVWSQIPISQTTTYNVKVKNIRGWPRTKASIMLFISVYMLMHLIRSGNAFLTKVSITPLQRPKHLPKFAKMSTTSDVAAWSWSDLQTMVGETSVGTALNEESRLRLEGKGSAHVQNKLRKFDSDDEPVITLFRDHAGWYADSTHRRFDGMKKCVGY